MQEAGFAKVNKRKTRKVQLATVGKAPICMQSDYHETSVNPFIILGIGQ